MSVNNINKDNYVTLKVENIVSGRKSTISGIITEVEGDEIYLRLEDGTEKAISLS